MADDTRQRLGFQAEQAETQYPWSPAQSEPALQHGNEETIPAPVSDYLDHLTAGLLKLPYAEREAIRTEVRLHLLASIAAFEEIGESRERAVLQALAQFGDPRLLARSFVRSWESTGKNRHTFPIAAMWDAVRFFGVSALLLLMGETFVMHYSGPIPPISGIIFSKILLAILLGIPIWGGWRLGGYRRAALGAFSGVGALAATMVPILILAGLLPPYLEHIPYLGALFATWTPIATISAAVSHMYRQRQHAHWRLT